jgi:putative membrane protein insertion efficiency factor
MNDSIPAPAPEAAPGLPARALIQLVRGYRLLLSPWLGSACRFEPTCSAYAIGALQTHGAARGSYLTLRRLARCHPWCDGGHDPVPSAGTALFSSLLSNDKKSAP